MKRKLLFCFTLFSILYSLSSFAQLTTFNTTVGSTGYTGTNNAGTGLTAYVSFAIANNSGGPVKLKNVGNWSSSATNTTYTLYYSATAISGPVDLSQTSIWTSIATGTSTVTATALSVNDVLTGINFIIPANTTYRFALLKASGTNYYSGSATAGAATPNVFTSTSLPGCSLLVNEHQINSAYVGYCGGNSPRAFTGSVTIERLSLSPNNASISEFVGPKNFCAGNQDIKVKLKNNGTNVINNVSVQWQLDGVLQTPIFWNSPLDTFGGTTYRNDTNITLGNVPFTSGRTIKVWTEYPNFVADTVNTDDTIKVTVAPALSGNFTINPLGSGSTNFTSFTALTNALTAYGVCGPVNITVASGTYTEQVVFTQIAGVSATNTITIDGVDTSTRVLEFSAGTTSYPTLSIVGVPYMTVRNLSIRATNATNGFGVLINGASDYSRISKCNITSFNGATGSTRNCIVVGGSFTSYSAGGKVDNIMIDSNTTTGGYFGIVFYQGSAAIGLNNKIIYNNVLNTYQYGIYSYYNNGVTISNNFINGGKYITSNYGIYCSTNNNNGTNTVQINNNRVINVGAYALYVTGSNTLGNKGRISNNMFGGGMRYGSNYLCYLSGSYWSIAHNTIHRDFATATATYGGFYIASASGISIMNNVFSSAKSGSIGLPLYVVSAATLDSMDYNTFYREDISNNNLIYVGSNLSPTSFKGSGGFNTNSIYTNPQFINDTNIVVRNACLPSIPLSYITQDIYGVNRNASQPTAGATEYIKFSQDAKVLAISYPIAPFTAGFQNIGIRIRNAGTSTLNSLQVSYTSNGGAPVTTFWTGTLASCDTTTVVFNFGNQFNITSLHKMVFYCSAPNGLTDGDMSNDTIYATFVLPLNGTYTVGGLGADFATAAEAVSALQIAGVSGPVVMNFTPGMKFTAGFEIPAIVGASATNTITLNGNGDTLVGNTGTFIVSFAGAKHINLNGFYMQAADFTSPGIGIHFRNASQYITLKNNTVDMGMTATATTTAAIAFSAVSSSATTAGNNGKNITIDSNILIGGYYGISMYGEASYLNCTGNKITNNIIRDFYVYGIYGSNWDSTLIYNNDLHRMNRSTITTFYGIYGTTTRYSKINNNKIHDAGSAAYSAYCIYLNGSANTAGYETECINNTIYNLKTTGLIYGIYLTGTRDRMKFFHNTVALDIPSGSTGAIRCIFMSTAPTNHTFRNNIASITGNGTGAKYTIYASAASATVSSDYNVLHMGATGGTINAIGYIGADRITLADWQTNSLLDANSVAANPVFSSLSTGNLSPLSSNIDNLGTPVGVLTDITGTTRSTTAPDAGAYEFTGIAGDIALTGGRVSSASTCYSNNDSAFITINNIIGSAVDFSINPLTINWSVTGPINSNGSIFVTSGTLASNASATYFTNMLDRSLPGEYTLSAYLSPNAVNSSASNDTLIAVNSKVYPILSVLTKTFNVNTPTDTVVLQASSPLFPGGGFKFTEVRHTSSTAPLAGWPAYLGTTVDYVEISGVPNSDLGGLTFEQWNATSLISTHTFPPGTLLSPNGTAIIGVGAIGANVPAPASFYYHAHGGSTTDFDSGGGQVGRVLKDNTGTVIDAFIYTGSGSYTFPAASGVTATDWSGQMPNSVSTSGLRLTGADMNNATNWIIANTSPNLQDPNTFNSGVPAIAPGILTGFNWSLNGTSFSTTPHTVVGPYTVPGTYTYIASYTNACGTFYDTVFVIAGQGVPVKLASFDAKANGNDVLVSWQTASEKNVSHFEVYKSFDNKNWTLVNEMKAAGNSNKTINYRTVDIDAMNTLSAMIYYKLKSVDNDGTAEWSKEAVVNVYNKQTPIVVYPNPFNATVNISLPENGKANVTITSLHGETVISQTIIAENSAATIKGLDNLKPGVYFIKVTQNGVMLVEKLVKN